MNKFHEARDDEKFATTAPRNPAPGIRAPSPSIFTAPRLVEPARIVSKDNVTGAILRVGPAHSAPNRAQLPSEIAPDSRFSNRHKPRLEWHVTHSKQTTAPRSNRHIQGGTERQNSLRRPSGCPAETSSESAPNLNSQAFAGHHFLTLRILGIHI
jgi:hypothetical protein